MYEDCPFLSFCGNSFRHQAYGNQEYEYCSACYRNPEGKTHRQPHKSPRSYSLQNDNSMQHTGQTYRKTYGGPVWLSYACCRSCPETSHDIRRQNASGSKTTYNKAKHQ